MSENGLNKDYVKIYERLMADVMMDRLLDLRRVRFVYECNGKSVEGLVEVDVVGGICRFNDGDGVDVEMSLESAMMFTKIIGEGKGVFNV